MHVIISLGFADKLFLLHSAVLKPNGDLAFWEVGCRRDASSLVFGDKLACCILLFQFFQLYLGVGNTLFAPSTVTADFWLQRNNIWKTKSKRKHYYNPFAQWNTAERHGIWHQWEMSYLFNKVFNGCVKWFKYLGPILSQLNEVLVMSLLWVALFIESII